MPAFLAGGFSVVSLPGSSRLWRSLSRLSRFPQIKTAKLRRLTAIGSTTFFGVSIKPQILRTFALIRKFAGKSFCYNLIGSISNNDCYMIGQTPVPTNKEQGMWFKRKQPFVGGALRDEPKNGCEGD